MDQDLHEVTACILYSTKQPQVEIVNESVIEYLVLNLVALSEINLVLLSTLHHETSGSGYSLTWDVNTSALPVRTILRATFMLVLLSNHLKLIAVLPRLAWIAWFTSKSQTRPMGLKSTKFRH